MNNHNNLPVIGFIGLGHMGLYMAANLVKAGYRVVGMDLMNEARARALATGVELAANNIEVAKAADILITMLPMGQHVLEVWQEVLPAIKPHALMIDCSTIDVETARLVHDLAQQQGCLSVDAPVSGGTVGAEAGTLTFMVGGALQAFAAAAPILEKMGQRVIHCGANGAGQAAKICNNMVLGISMLGVCEAFALGEKLGLSSKALYDVASTSSGACWALTTNCPVAGPVPASPANRDYQPGFAMKLMAKDLGLAQHAAVDCGAQTPLGSLAANFFRLVAQQGYGEQDFSAIIKFLRSQ